MQYLVPNRTDRKTKLMEKGNAVTGMARQYFMQETAYPRSGAAPFSCVKLQTGRRST